MNLAGFDILSSAVGHEVRDGEIIVGGPAALEVLVVWLGGRRNNRNAPQAVPFGYQPDVQMANLRLRGFTLT